VVAMAPVEQNAAAAISEARRKLVLKLNISRRPTLDNGPHEPLMNYVHS